MGDSQQIKAQRLEQTLSTTLVHFMSASGTAFSVARAATASASAAGGAQPHERVSILALSVTAASEIASERGTASVLRPEDDADVSRIVHYSLCLHLITRAMAEDPAWRKRTSEVWNLTLEMLGSKQFPNHENQSKRSCCPVAICTGASRAVRRCNLGTKVNVSLLRALVPGG